LTIVSKFVLASNPPNITDSELAMLPKYCLYTPNPIGSNNNSNSPLRASWETLIGHSYIHLHHYCWGLIEFRRAERQRMSPDLKHSLREAALGDFIYVVNNTPNDFILLPEILTWIGKTEFLLNRPNKATEAFTRAQQIKPDYWPAYSYWAEFLIGKSMKSEALNIVKKGLEYSPNSKVLLKMFHNLGGNSADIPQAKLLDKKDANPAQDALENEAPTMNKSDMTPPSAE
jgi:tetratricopeptide (TPR) repeat protein